MMKAISRLEITINPRRYYEDLDEEKEVRKDQRLNIGPTKVVSVNLSIRMKKYMAGVNLIPDLS